ncbi:thymidylate synthase [Halomonas daqingensis]|uniref:thymidylate synthase n=1 Tax=Billgrantia desiderata TaxID=52021 RepID=UPI001F326618|nr:thymidylate synthase [Halomonas desiderata]MCE8009999.1 thymidylate synthase [Halomonas desiderata]MCE8030991.1 thymidylate synthase [Halomonas desiderata]
MYLEEQSLDDILMRLYTDFSTEEWDYVSATKGPNYEKRSVLIRLNKPRSRVSMTEGKGTIFSCLGELIWYLSGSNNLEQIQYYLKDYHKFSDDGKTIYGSYGPRVFGPKRKNQMENIIRLLRKNPESRKAVIQIFSGKDIKKPHKDVPCTCTLQFMVRDSKLHLFTSMRSNDMYRGLPHDIFSFTMIQEIVARRLGVDLGVYNHYVTSMHLYEHDIEAAKRFMREGWQDSEEMPAMPTTNIKANIRNLIIFERDVRHGKQVDIFNYFESPYWSDLGRLLQFFWHSNNQNNNSELSKIKSSFQHGTYNHYLEKRLKSINTKDKNCASL